MGLLLEEQEGQGAVTNKKPRRNCLNSISTCGDMPLSVYNLFPSHLHSTVFLQYTCWLNMEYTLCWISDCLSTTKREILCGLQSYTCSMSHTKCRLCDGKGIVCTSVAQSLSCRINEDSWSVVYRRSWVTNENSNQTVIIIISLIYKYKYNKWHWQSCHHVPNKWCVHTALHATEYLFQNAALHIMGIGLYYKNQHKN